MSIKNFRRRLHRLAVVWICQNSRRFRRTRSRWRLTSSRVFRRQVYITASTISEINTWRICFSMVSSLGGRMGIKVRELPVVASQLWTHRKSSKLFYAKYWLTRSACLFLRERWGRCRGYMGSKGWVQAGMVDKYPYPPDYTTLTSKKRWKCAEQNKSSSPGRLRYPW